MKKIIIDGVLEACGVLYCSQLAERLVRNSAAQEPGK